MEAARPVQPGAEEERTELPPDTGEDSMEEEDGFDLMSVLTQLAEEMEEVTTIDAMDAYGEKVVDITLEELVKYVQKTIYHR